MDCIQKWKMTKTITKQNRKIIKTVRNIHYGIKPVLRGHIWDKEKVR